MAHVEERTISLPAEQAGYVDALVASGRYGSISAVVRAGLRALQVHDVAVERWLTQEVATTYDAMCRDPSRAVPAETVEQVVLAHHAQQMNVERGT